MPEEQKSPLRIEPEKLIPGKGLDEMDLSVNDSSIDLISRENPIGWFGNLFTGAFTASIFQCDHQKFRAKDHSFDEFILILEGKLTLTEDTGEVHNFTKGDLLVYPKAFSGTWENSDNYKEFIIIQTGALDDIPSMEGMD